MPLYNSATVAAAIGASTKWLDNLLSHNKIDGSSGGRQGVHRRLSTDAVQTIALVKELMEVAELSASAAVRIASVALADDSSQRPVDRRRIQLSPSIWLELDLAALDHKVAEGLAHAVEITPHPVRGRPAGERRNSRRSNRPNDR